MKWKVSGQQLSIILPLTNFIWWPFSSDILLCDPLKRFDTSHIYTCIYSIPEYSNLSNNHCPLFPSSYILSLNNIFYRLPLQTANVGIQAPIGKHCLKRTIHYLLLFTFNVKIDMIECRYPQTIFRFLSNTSTRGHCLTSTA